MARLPLLGFVLAACSTELPATVPGSEMPGAEPREPAPYLPDLEVEGASPTLTNDEVGALIEDRFAALVTAVPLRFPEAFLGLTDYLAANCPGGFVDESVGSRSELVVRNNCNVDGGITGSINFSYESGTVDEEGNDVDGVEFFAQDFRVETRDGRLLEADGYFSFRHTRNAQSSYASSYCSGRLRADGTTAGDDPWLRGEVEGFVSTFVGNFNGYRIASVEATVATEDDALAGISIPGLRWEPGQCDVELLGSGSIREIGGVWHDVVFATRIEETDEVLECDGCGAYQAAGAPQSEPVCHSDQLANLVDFSGGLPW